MPEEKKDLVHRASIWAGLIANGGKIISAMALGGAAVWAWFFLPRNQFAPVPLAIPAPVDRDQKPAEVIHTHKWQLEFLTRSDPPKAAPQAGPVV